MRCTEPMKAPRPPPTIPARRRRVGRAIATLVMRAPDATSKTSPDITARPPRYHLRPGVLDERGLARAVRGQLCAGGGAALSWTRAVVQHVPVLRLLCHR